MDNNNDLSGMLSKLLENPEALSSVMKIAGSLMNNIPNETSESQAEPSNIKPNSISRNNDGSMNTFENSSNDAVPTSAQQSMPDLSALSALVGIADKANKKSDPRCNLLNALRPYMSHGRTEKIDMMIKALGLAELADGFLNNKKLF